MGNLAIAEMLSMMRRTRFEKLIVLTACLVIFSTARFARAQDATPAPAPAPADATATPATAPSADATSQPAAPAAIPIPPGLVDQVDMLWRGARVGRYDLADAAGEAIIAGTNAPDDILKAFETVATRFHYDNDIDETFRRWRNLVPPSDEDIARQPSLADQRDNVIKMRDMAGRLGDRIDQGYEARRADPTFIINTIVAMSKSTQAYSNNLTRLNKSGELAAKVCVDILRSAAKAEFHSTARRALIQLGRAALNPLLAATEMKDYGALRDVIVILGQLKYDAAVPYLARLSVAAELPEDIHVAARNALLHMGASSTGSVADAFLTEAEKCYYGRSSITPTSPLISYVWFWSDDNGLYKMNVPTPIFGDVMAMRLCEYAKKADKGNAAADSLWLAANTKREIDLPDGATDITHKDARPASYFNHSVGVQYVSAALARAQNDNNAQLALRLTQALEDMIGLANLPTNSENPLYKDFFFPNRQVRYEAAFTLAEAMPTQPFPGSNQVVPLLVQALSQTGKPNVLVVAPGDMQATLHDAIVGLGYPVVTAGDATQGANLSLQLPSIDVIVITENANVQQMLMLAQTSRQLQGASILVLTQTQANPYVAQAAMDPLMNTAVITAKEGLPDMLKTEISKALAHSGAGVISDQQGSDYALKAADLLRKIAVAHNSVFNLATAEGGVLTALNDSRAPVAEAAGETLGYIKSPSAQQGLGAKALDPGTPTEIRVSLFHSLAASARNFGNMLTANQISALEKVVNSEKDDSVRDAAAAARGALSLPADSASYLILLQSRT
jgi:hypothetical protein